MNVYEVVPLTYLRLRCTCWFVVSEHGRHGMENEWAHFTRYTGALYRERYTLKAVLRRAWSTLVRYTLTFFARTFVDQDDVPAKLRLDRPLQLADRRREGNLFKLGRH